MTRTKLFFAAIAGLTALGGVSSAFAYTAPNLGSTASFAVLSTEPGTRGAVTCTDSTVAGTVGSSGARPAVVSTRCSISGGIVAPVRARVLSDYSLAYNQINANTCQHILSGTQAGAILAPGVYCFDAAAALTGTMTLNGPVSGSG